MSRDRRDDDRYDDRPSRRDRDDYGPPPRASSKLPWVLGGLFVLGLVCCGVPALFMGALGLGGKKERGEGAATAKTGEEVVFGDSKWTVLAAEDKGNSLKSNNRLQKDASTDGRFILVRFKVVNTTSKEEKLLRAPVVVDDQGREFKEIERQTFYLPEGTTSLTMKALPAGMTKEFAAIYEVPADAKGLKFQARALAAFGDKALVDLGL